MGVPADFRAGERAVFPEGYDCYPNFRLQGRLVGTVTEVEPDYVMVKLDMHKPELDEWGNCIQAWVDPTSGAVSCLEPLRTQALRERHEARLVRGVAGEERPAGHVRRRASLRERDAGPEGLARQVLDRVELLDRPAGRLKEN